MADFKDLFSRQASDYARFRPSYPSQLFDELAQRSGARGLAIDLGCGNGQASAALARRFERVIGVDPSQAQLDQAPALANARFACAAAESTGLAGGEADLITVAQAFHWFKLPQAFEEIQRLAKPGGLVALWSYGHCRISPGVDAVTWKLYEELLGAYWDPDRRKVEDGYANIAFPPSWQVLAMPPVSMGQEWALEEFAGYLSTWSPLKRFQEDKGFDPLQAVLPAMAQAWGPEGKRSVQWPLNLRVFKVPT